MATQPNRAWIPALVGALAFALMAALWCTGQTAVFHEIVRQWGVDAYHYPFYDMQGLLSALECTRKGIDAYVANPCDPTGRVYDYPPSWSILTRLPVTSAWLMPLGLALDAAFLASLLLLPSARTPAGTRIVVLGVLSTATVFAVERANNDLAVFVLVALAAALLSRRPGNAAAYALIQLAGLLKYFPLAAMALALREPPARFLAIAAASLATTALFAVTTWPDLIHALHNIPVGSPFRTVFGASNLGGGLVLLGAPAWLGHSVTVVATLAGLAVGIRLGLRPDAGAAVAILDHRERTFLLAGGFVVLGCFFATQNIDYRAVHMLLLLPSLTALMRPDCPRRYATLAWVALVLLWLDYFRLRILAIGYLVGGTTQKLIAAGPGFVLREALWWWFAILLVALVTALLRDAPVIAFVTRRFSSTPLRAAGS